MDPAIIQQYKKKYILEQLKKHNIFPHRNTDYRELKYLLATVRAVNN